MKKFIKLLEDLHADDLKPDLAIIKKMLKHIR